MCIVCVCVCVCCESLDECKCCVIVLKEELKFVNFSHKITEIANILKHMEKTGLLWSLKII